MKKVNQKATAVLETANATGIAVPQKAAKVEAPAKVKKVGVIQTIVSSILNAGKAGISKPEIHEILVAAFPERQSWSMMATINVQVPGRINSERPFKLEKLENGNFRKIEKAAK